MPRGRLSATGGGYNESCAPARAATDCVAGAPSWNGLRTGACLPSPDDAGAFFCEVAGWCPPEAREAPPLRLAGVEDFTLFVRVNARWPRWPGLSWDNANGTAPSPGWNVWRLGDVLAAAGVSLADGATRDSGADVALALRLDCDLDASPRACLPALPAPSWRLDTPGSALSRGYNRREAVLHSDGSRTLTKAAGVRVRVLLSGTGRRFDVVETATRIGAGLGLLSLVTALVDALALYVAPRRAWYTAVKYDTVREADGGGDGEALEQPLLGEARSPAEEADAA
jgi:hypothetical protein